MACVFIGDSIAVGVAAYTPACINQAHVGQTTGQTLDTIKQLPHRANHVIVSVGSNDRPNVTAELIALRTQLGNKCVTWLLPFANKKIRWEITRLAQKHGDRILDIKPLVSGDGVHPTRAGYETLAKQLKSNNDCSIHSAK